MSTENDARERVLEVAERLFTEKGYNAVRLRDIADALDIKQASLYYHVPGGKEALFVEVVERGFDRHRNGLETAITEAGDALDARLNAVAGWLLSQTPINYSRMSSSDMPAISAEHAARLMDVGYHALLVPLENIFKDAQASGEIGERDFTMLAGIFLSIISGIQAVPVEMSAAQQRDSAKEMIDVLLYGLKVR